MTIIIALKDKRNNKIVFGSDRLETTGMIKGVCKNKIITKKIKIVDAYYNELDTKELHIGLAGYGFISELLEYNFTPPDMNEQQNFMEYLYEEFLDNLRETLLEKKLVSLDNDQFDSGSSILLIFDGEIYEVFSNFSVTHVTQDYAVCGAGWKIAIGSLYTNLHYHPNISAQEMVRQAITACGVNTIYCDANVDIKTIG